MLTEKKTFEIGDLIEYLPRSMYSAKNIDLDEKRIFAIVLKARELLQTADILFMKGGQIFKNINYDWISKVKQCALVENSLHIKHQVIHFNV